MELVHEYEPESLLYPYPHEVSEELSRKRKLLESIKLEVVAGPEGYGFNFTLEGTMISSSDNDDLSLFEEAVADFEERHPDISVKELLDKNEVVREDLPFGKRVKQLKENLATIEQTWG